jgi:hypothetical protein
VISNANQAIPDQENGGMIDVIHFVDFENRLEAHKLFRLAKNRLKDISNWHQFSEPGSSKLSLADAQGNELYRKAEKSDPFM